MLFYDFLAPRLRWGDIILCNYAKKKPAGIAAIFGKYLQTQCLYEIFKVSTVFLIFLYAYTFSFQITTKGSLEPYFFPLS
jgi:hypothetical protein